MTARHGTALPFWSPSIRLGRAKPNWLRSVGHVLAPIDRSTWTILIKAFAVADHGWTAPHYGNQRDNQQNCFLHNHNSHKQIERCAWNPSRKGRCESDRGAPKNRWLPGLAAVGFPVLYRKRPSFMISPSAGDFEIPRRKAFETKTKSLN